MPEGPSIILVKEAAAKFVGKKFIAVSGNSKIDQRILLDKEIIEFKCWEKHFLICLDGLTLKVHFLMFGSYTIDEKKPDRAIRLNLTFENGEINFYTCSVKYLEGDINKYYDWSADVMNANWSPKNARRKLKEEPQKYICDPQLEQDIFAGVGNIIKNEILYIVKVHPESKVEKIPSPKIKRLIEKACDYSFRFLEWKRNYELKKHLLAHTKKICLRCKLPIIRKHTGIKNRRSFLCVRCQKLYA